MYENSAGPLPGWGVGAQALAGIEEGSGDKSPSVEDLQGMVREAVRARGSVAVSAKFKPDLRLVEGLFEWVEIILWDSRKAWRLRRVGRGGSSTCMHLGKVLV